MDQSLGLGPKITPPPRRRGDRELPRLALPVPFCAKGFFPPPLTSDLVLVDAVPCLVSFRPLGQSAIPRSISVSTLYAVALSVRGWLRLVRLVSTRSCSHSFHVFFSFRVSCVTHPSGILLSIDEVSMDESFCGLFTCGGQVEIGVSLFFSFEVSFDHGFGPRGGGPVAFLSHHLHLFRLPSHRHFLSQVRGTCERGDGCHGGALAHPPTLPRLHSPALTHPSPTSQPTSQPKRPSPPLPSSPERGERGRSTGGSTWPFSLLFFMLFVFTIVDEGRKAICSRGGRYGDRQGRGDPPPVARRCGIDPFPRGLPKEP